MFFFTASPNRYGFETALKESLSAKRLHVAAPLTTLVLKTVNVLGLIATFA
jgi:hypothetical protein